MPICFAIDRMFHTTASTCVIISGLAPFYKRALPMQEPKEPQFRQPIHNYPIRHLNVDTCWLDTEHETPAMPKESSFSGTLGWHNSLPQIRKPDYPSEWDKPQKKQIDVEKIAARVTWACMGIFAFAVMLVFMLKIIGMVAALK